MKKIFVLNLRGNIIGDSLREDALFQYLKARYPDSYVTTTGGTVVESIHKNNPNIDKFILIKELDNLTKDIPKIKKINYMLKAMIKSHKLMIGYDVVIITQKIKLPFLVLAKLSGVKEILKKEDLPYKKYFGRMYFTKDEENKIRRYLVKGRRIAINIESIDPKRCWNRNNYSVFIGRLLEKGYKVYILGLDNEYNKPLIDSFGHSIRNLIGKTSIRESALIIKNADLFVGNDSGLAHIAAAADTNSLIILLDSKVDILNDPRKCRAIKLRKPSVDEVYKEVLRLL
jgi:ADP-heptose:LPS heptosyltransferase